MINFDDIGQDTILARGRYATVRSAHEDAKKRLSILCGQMGTVAPQVLRYMQPDNDDTPEMGGALSLLSYGRDILDKIEECVGEIELLAMQRAALKQAAWGKK